MAYLFLCLALVNSVGIALLLRVFENQGKNRLVVIAANYITAGSLAYLFAANTRTASGISGFAVFIGLCFFLAFIVFGQSIKQKGIGSSVTFGRLSLAIPVLLSIILWGEKPSVIDIVGLGFIFLIILCWEGKPGKISPLLLTLFILFGINDAAMKFFKLHFPSIDDSFFLALVFFSAMAWSWGYTLVISRQRIKRGDVLAGLCLGIPNYLCSYFLLKTLEKIPAYTVFPLINTGIILVSALMGYLLFQEKLDRKRLLFIFLGIVAVILLTI